MGAIFHNGKPYGGGGILNLVTKSWSDYNALSLAERNDSTKWYFVPDAPASGVPNIVKSVRDNITDAYDPESTYNKDDWCIYDNKLYICTTNNTTGEWDSTKWTRKNLEEIIGSLNSALTDYIVSETYTFANTGSLAAGGTKALGETMPTKQGYKILTITPDYSGDDKFAMTMCRYNPANNTGSVWIYNAGSTADSGAPMVQVIYVRDI